MGRWEELKYAQHLDFIFKLYISLYLRISITFVIFIIMYSLVFGHTKNWNVSSLLCIICVQLWFNSQCCGLGILFSSHLWDQQPYFDSGISVCCLRCVFQVSWWYVLVTILSYKDGGIRSRSSYSATSALHIFSCSGALCSWYRYVSFTFTDYCFR